MPRFAANLSMLYPELAFLDRFEAAARDGFEGVEFLVPYSFDVAEIAARLKDIGLPLVLFNTPAAGEDPIAMQRAWDAGERGLACVPGREAEFRTGLSLALDYARALACPRIHVMAGVMPSGLTRDAVRPTFVDNLRWAARQAAPDGIRLLIEPINTRDNPGFFLNRQDHAHELLAEIGADNVQVQMDLYHCQVVEGDVAMKIREYLPTGRVGHFQVAGVPQRQEPDLGELNCDYLFDVIDEVSAACGWQGWVSAEYRPQRGTEGGGTTAGLGWLRRRAARP
jgi:2-dehydrotetronate isomerase